MVENQEIENKVVEIEIENNETDESLCETNSSITPQTERACRRETFPKTIKDLSKTERKEITQRLKDGETVDGFELKIMKNGGSRLVVKKVKPVNISEKVVKKESNLIPNTPVKLSNEQLLLEHIIELEKKMTKLTKKQKKLKGKYRNLKQDVYYTEEDESVLVDEESVEKVPEKDEIINQKEGAKCYLTEKTAEWKLNSKDQLKMWRFPVKWKLAKPLYFLSRFMNQNQYV
jgi:hypothetical protein